MARKKGNLYELYRTMYQNLIEEYNVIEPYDGMLTKEEFNLNIAEMGGNKISAASELAAAGVFKYTHEEAENILNLAQELGISVEETAASLRRNSGMTDNLVSELYEKFRDNEVMKARNLEPLKYMGKSDEEVAAMIGVSYAWSDYAGSHIYGSP